MSVSSTAEAAQFFLSDGIVLSGSQTGDPTSPEDLREVKSSVTIPVLIGSGVTVDNLDLYRKADAVIVGSHFKRDGKWFNEIVEPQVKRFMERC